MNATIKSILMENFKGCQQKEQHEFYGNNATILGENGAGKTTIATAYCWLFSDRDYDLHSNPNIRPIGAKELTPRVEIVLDIEGKEVTVVKQQKRTEKKDGSISLSNSYEANSVEYGERDFKKKLNEYGFDFDLFLALSHPDVFTGQKSNDMRKVLFSMASEKSDREIADMTEGAEDAAALLDNYTMEEVKAMQNATIRKIREVYGKDGEILRAKIEGLEMSKVDIDVAELELGKKSLLEKIAANKAKQADVSRQFEEYQKLSDGILELQFQLSDLQTKANEENNKKKRDIDRGIVMAQECIDDLEERNKKDQRHIEASSHDCEMFKKKIEGWRKEWTRVNALEFDERSLVCSYCRQEYPVDKKEQIKADFEQKKADNLAKITENGNDLSRTIKSLEKERGECQKHIDERNQKIAEHKEYIAEKEKERASLPDSIDISDTDEYKSIQSQIAEKEQAMNKETTASESRGKLEIDLIELQSQLTEIEKQLALSQRNVEIDEQISDLRKKQTEYEQSKANAEKILYQLDLISRKRNELLTDDINSHFDVVRWQMFEYQKNGEYKECCVPLIDGKRFGESTNTGREILAKLDIIKGLQRFYGMYFPVFLDGSEVLSESTMKQINMDCQMIYLKVSEDRELKVLTK